MITFLAPRAARRLNTDHLELVGLLARLAPLPHAFKIANVVASLIKSAAEVRFFDEIACDRELENEEEKHHARHLARCASLAAKLGCTVIHHGDPRGYCVRLTAPGLRGNTWGGDDSGFGVI